MWRSFTWFWKQRSKNQKIVYSSILILDFDTLICIVKTFASGPIILGQLTETDVDKTKHQIFISLILSSDFGMYIKCIS